MAKDSPAKIQSIVGGCRRSGRWRVPAQTTVLTLFGRSFIDLRHAETSAEELEFSCLSVFANVTIVVPDGAEVRPSGLAVLGSQRSFVPLADTPSSLPVLSVDAVTVFGKLRVLTGDQLDQPSRRQQRRDRRRGPKVTGSDHERDLGPDGVEPLTSSPTGSEPQRSAEPVDPAANSERAAAAPDPFDDAEPVDFAAREGSIDPGLVVPADWSPDGPPSTLVEAMPDTADLAPTDIAPELSDDVER